MRNLNHNQGKGGVQSLSLTITFLILYVKVHSIIKSISQLIITSLVTPVSCVTTNNIPLQVNLQPTLKCLSPAGAVAPVSLKLLGSAGRTCPVATHKHIFNSICKAGFQPTKIAIPSPQHNLHSQAPSHALDTTTYQPSCAILGCTE